jgi:hypothetical protein
MARTVAPRRWYREQKRSLANHPAVASPLD